MAFRNSGSFSDFISRNSVPLCSLFLLAVSMQLMSASSRNPKIANSGALVIDTVLVPLEKGYHEVSESTKYLWTHYVWLLDVENERNSLLDRVKELEALNSRLMEHQRENDRLRGILQFSNTTSQQGVVATVVGRDPSNWIQTITIDRGADQGIAIGMAVVDGNAIVGQVTSVTAGSSKVLLLTDSTSAIDAIVQSSRATGIAEGGMHGGLLRLRYVERLQEIPVRAGDRVIASGLDGVYPKGTLIGVVHRTDESKGGLFQFIEVAPSADLRRLENVLVIAPDLKGALNEGEGGK